MSNTEKTIKIWDPFIRIFHWTLVLSFFIAYITEEDYLTIHSFAGYTLLALLSLRIVWGFIGTRHARFSDFTYSPQTIKAFIKDTIKARAKRYLGHNPAGGAMILLLIISLLITSFTGIAVYGLEEQSGPLASWFTQKDSFWGEVFEETHEFFANFTLLLIFIHVAGVIVESLIHKENLVKSMIDGKKRADSDSH
ncbi:MAG: cytochrome b/b6 domain-containing protein [Gammaproteobacteria bacterium]|nr:cytochrome b/b6 domain-containing protein [Gammaproteobacteria bacterium]MCW8986042.1 cytochrome b/b6 domain-containing protein [Gammaproteobacteria bacterium]MCW9031508.1 cytochrome b/b6 domain-containing protein [Gammaproteobacteria bacterium]